MIKWTKKSEDLFAEIKKYSNKKNYKIEQRNYFAKHYSYAIPSKIAIKKIAKFSNNEEILEIGAGIGLWAFLLQEIKINIHPTDNFRWKKLFSKKYYTTVEKLTINESLQKYDDSNILLLIWPPNGDYMANYSLTRFKGNKFIYIGEEGGCTANDDFEDLLEEEWDEVDRYSIPTWPHIYDIMRFFTRKKNETKISKN